MANDILLEETPNLNTFDVSIEDGDFKLGADTQQRVQLILLAQQGHFKQHPLCGAGMESMLGGVLSQPLKRNIRLQLESDGLKVSRVLFDNQSLKIDLR